jgi:DNA invertase Pin-like site-specific DNA recombinase
MLTITDEFRTQKVNLRFLNLGGGNVDTGTPTGSMVFTVMTALAQMKLEIKRERVNDSNTKRCDAGMYLGRRPIFPTGRLLTRVGLLNRDSLRPMLPVTWACPGRLCTDASPT